MGQDSSTSVIDCIVIKKNHPLSEDCFKLVKLVLPHMAVIFRKSNWVLEGVVLHAKTYKLDKVGMLSISKFVGDGKDEKCRLEFDFLERKVRYLTFSVDKVQASYEHQLVKKMHLTQKYKVRCPQRKHALNVLESTIVQNGY